MTLDKDSGMNLLGEAIEVMRDITFEKGGQMEVKMASRTVSLREETELQAMMDKLALENKKVDGDAPEDE